MKMELYTIPVRQYIRAHKLYFPSSITPTLSIPYPFERFYCMTSFVNNQAERKLISCPVFVFHKHTNSSFDIGLNEQIFGLQNQLGIEVSNTPTSIICRRQSVNGSEHRYINRYARAIRTTQETRVILP